VSTISPPAVAVGRQTPTWSVAPDAPTSAGDEAIDLAATAGLLLDPWQQLVLRKALGETVEGRWAAKDVGLLVARQNGKGAILEARELAGLFLFGDRLIIHSAHLFETSMGHFDRLLSLIEGTPEFDRRVKRVSRSHGDESISLRSGEKIKFKTRTKGGGRGLSGDLVVLDEAMELPTAVMSALRPVMRARPNPQLWMVGSAVDQTIHAHGVEFARARSAAKTGTDETAAWFEWTADEAEYARDPDAVADDPEQWVKSTPGLGFRIEVETMAGERVKMDRRGFATELLSVGDWPSVDDDGDEDRFQACWPDLASPTATIADGSPLVFAFDVSPDREWATVAVAGWSDGGAPHVEVTGDRSGYDRRPGTRWVVDRLLQLAESRRPVAVVLDERSPAASLLDELERAGLQVADDRGPTPNRLLVSTTTRQMVAACGQMFDAVVSGELEHRGQAIADEAVSTASRRTLAGAWAWQRKAGGDITPLVAETLALWGLQQFGHDDRDTDPGPFSFVT